MTYELAQQLKDAGFPQFKYDGGILVPYGWVNGKKINEQVYQPTLSELIEACPKEYKVPDYLDVDCDFGLQWYGAGWVAGYIHYDWMPLEERGQTPEEAVAKLWLALKKSLSQE
jgi:hypothetical protein